LCKIPPGQGLKSGDKRCCSRYSIPDSGPKIWLGATSWSPLQKLFVTQVQAFGDAQITWAVNLSQVSQHAAALPNKLEQSTPAGLIFFVDPKMIGQLQDAAGQNGNLHFWGTGICIMAMIVRDQFCLNFFRERHDVCFPFLPLVSLLTELSIAYPDEGRYEYQV
jgi:hypothetical protein